ncbi:MAG TPA: 50S ribosomal protein L11 methyltransferase [Myxococcota bacterium]|nr:50S ribosomal protein L11 methyltransferase [Myxococcota bacterium]
MRIEVRADDVAVAERAAGEAWEGGIVGLEEREAAGGTVLLILYAPAAKGDAVRDALVKALAGTAEVTQPRPELEVDWSIAWRTGLEAIEISPRLVVRPPFARFEPHPGQACVVIEPGQAFGTGGHDSTRLVLELLDGLERDRVEGARVLDVGCGSGVLALAALALGARGAVGFDMDPRAAQAAAANALANGRDGQFQVFIGPLDAIMGLPFDLVLVNLLRTELLPLAGGLARLTRAGGTLIASGLLASERAEVCARFRATGLRVEGDRTSTDAGGEPWLGLVMRR